MVAATPYFKTLPFNISDPQEFQKRVSEVIGRLVQGKVNVTLPVTLNPGATTTVINDARISFYSAIIPAMATTSNGATAIKNGIWVNGLNTGTATINHASNAATDQNITFVIIG